MNPTGIPWAAVVYERDGKTEVCGWTSDRRVARRVAEKIRIMPFSHRPMCVVVVKEVRRA